jgi:hypothetical protein
MLYNIYTEFEEYDPHLQDNRLTNQQAEIASSFFVRCLLGLHLNPDDGSSEFPSNVCELLPDYKA